MTRGQSKKGQHKDKAKLAQTPKNQIIPDGQDIEFSQEIADQDDFEAQQRSEAANARAQKRK
ncbi:YfhD family protein [Bacillus tianshenii]|nr:YfhD family protein [Bacillus tianshenii]